MKSRIKNHYLVQPRWTKNELGHSMNLSITSIDSVFEFHNLRMLCIPLKNATKRKVNEIFHWIVNFRMMKLRFDAGNRTNIAGIENIHFVQNIKKSTWTLVSKWVLLGWTVPLSHSISLPWTNSDENFPNSDWEFINLSIYWISAVFQRVFRSVVLHSFKVASNRWPIFQLKTIKYLQNIE